MKRLLIIILTLALISPLYAANNEKSYWFQRAEEAYGKQDYGKCMQRCERGIRENPKDAYCWAVIAKVCSKQVFARYGRALEAADEALKYLPKKDTQWISFVHAIRGDVYFKVGELAQSAEAYERAIAIQPDKIEYIYALADVYRNLKRYEDAEQLLRRIVDKEPSEAYVQAILAANYLEMGDTLNAIRRVKLSLALQPETNAAAHNVLFRKAWAEGDVPKAAAEYVELLKAEEYFGAAFDTLSLHEFPFVIAAAKQYVDGAPTDAARLSVVAAIYYKYSHYADAYLWLKQATELDEEKESMLTVIDSELALWDEHDQIIMQTMKKDSTLRVKLAQSYATRGDYDAAYRQYMLLRNSNSTEEFLYRELGRLLTNMQRYNEALAYMDTAIVMASEKSQAIMLFNRGEIYTRMNQPEKALQDYMAARDAAEDEETRVYIEALLGHTEPVQHYVDSVLQTNLFADSYLQLADLYAVMRDKEGILRMARLAFEHGKRVIPQDRAYRITFIKDDPDWLALLAEIEQARLTDISYIRRQEQATVETAVVTQIPFEKKGGVNQVQCTINGLSLYFVFDTGASDVSISDVEANFMLRNGYLTEQDFMGKQNYVTATGEIHEGTIVNLREVRVGNILLTNIKASVVKNQYAPLLLGQSVFRRFGSLEVDNNASVIRFVK